MSSRGADPPKNRATDETERRSHAPAALTKKKAPAQDILIGEPETDELRAFGGSRSDKFNGGLINTMAQTGWFPPGQTDEARNQQMFAAVAALRAFKPTDEIEGMLAAQTVAMHFGAMECFRRAMVYDQQPEAASKLRKDGANLARDGDLARADLASGWQINPDAEPVARAGRFRELTGTLRHGGQQTTLTGTLRHDGQQTTPTVY